jgi:hypothetical protein
MMTLSQIWPVLALIAGFQLKHFICDGPLQTKAMVVSKAHYGDRLGLVHALIHGAGAAIILVVFGQTIAVVLGLAAIDTVLHYHVDFTKENVVKRAGWKTSDAKFWWALSADQTLHQLSYLALAALALTI